MDIDMSILRMLEREKEISFDVLVEAIEQALLTAYHKTPGAREKARVELDRKTGHVTVLAAELDDDGNTVGEYDDTPEGFGRIAATTAKQIMLQRLRDAEDDVRFGEFSGREGDIISGTIQQGRNPDDVLVDWGRRGITGISPDDMAPLFDEVESVLGVQAVPDEVLGANGSIARRGAEALGWSGGPIRRNIRGCHGHGTCAFGCPIDAKQAMHVSYLPRAVDAGADVVAHARVRELLVEDGRVTGVLAELHDTDTGERRGELRVRARATVLAAGAVFTPVLLMGQKLARTSGQLGRNLVIHPGAGTSALFDEDLSAWRGTMQSWYVDEHLRDGVLLEATFPPPGLGYSAGSLPGWGRDGDLFGLYPRVASMGSICSDAGNGRVHRAGSGALIRYSLSRRDAQRVLDGIARSAELFFAAGATTVYPMLPGLDSISSPKEVEQIRSGRWNRSELHVSAYHPMGTARMGARPSDSVVDPWGSVWDVDGLWVLDASILPSSTHVNPQITIMAMAARGASRLADALS